MNFKYDIPKTFDDDLEDLLSSFYTAASLRSLYQIAVAPTLGLPVERKPPNKAAVVAALGTLVQDPARMPTFVENLPADLRQAIQGLLWVDKMPLVALEEFVGKDVAYFNPSASIRRHSELAYCLGEELDLLVLWFRRGYYASESELADRANYFVGLPPALRAWLKPFFPKPEGYYLTGSSKLPIGTQKAWKRFECGDRGLQDIVAVADFVRRGGVMENQNGSISRNCIRKLALATDGREPYPDTTCSPKLPYFRHEFLIRFVELLPNEEVTRLAEATTEPEVFLRRIPGYLARFPKFIGTCFLPHLKSDYGTFETGSDNLLAFLGIFKEFGLEQWLTREQILHFCAYRDHDGCFFTLSQFRTDVIKTTDRGWGRRWNQVGRDDKMALVTWPLFSGLALGLAALGLVEIAYTEPRNKEYYLQSRSFVTPFEGVQAVRLTALGAYAFGLSDVLEIAALETTGTKLHFAPDRLHVWGEEIDPITDAALRDYMEPVGPGLFKMTRSSFLKRCQTTEDVTDHIQQFQQRLAVELPPYWADFFKRLGQEPAALGREERWLVYALPENAEIRNAFIQDPVLRQHTLKVEGWRVAIEIHSLAQIEKRLRTLGLFAR